MSNKLFSFKSVIITLALVSVISFVIGSQMNDSAAAMGVAASASFVLCLIMVEDFFGGDE